LTNFFKSILLKKGLKLEKSMRIKGMEELNETKICYWKVADKWMLYLPNCGVGGLGNHEITEHEDGTITVSPSILMTGHLGNKRHGYLTKGMWTEV
jgi:hypothetical protein